MNVIVVALNLLLSASPGGELPPGHPPLAGGNGLPSNAPAGPRAGPLPAGHPAIQAGKTPPSAEQLLKQLDSTPDLKTKDKTFEVAAALGKLYYANGRFPDATLYFRQALEKTANAKTFLLAEQKLVQKSHRTVPTAEAAGCASASEAAMDGLFAKARAKAAAEDAPGAVACALAALRPVLEAESLLANALFLNGDVAGGLQEHERVLALDRDNPDSLYSHAGMLLDSKPDSVPALKTAQSELTRMLATSPQSSRSGSARKLLAWVDQAIAAGGTTALNKHRPAVRPPSAFASNAPAGAASRAPLPASALPADAPTALTPQMVEAVQNTEMTPEVVAGLGKLVEQGEEKLAHGQFQDALDAYKRVVPFQPENGRARAGMAWALVGLQRPMGDRIWSVAIQSDAGAMDKLGDTLLSKGDAAGARSLWKKLAQTAPDYASKAGLDKKVR